jgi:hypothetical protein
MVMSTFKFSSFSGPMLKGSSGSTIMSASLPGSSVPGFLFPGQVRAVSRDSAVLGRLFLRLRVDFGRACQRGGSNSAKKFTPG